MTENKRPDAPPDPPEQAEPGATSQPKPPSVEPLALGQITAPCKGCGSTEPPDEQGLCRGVPGNKCRWARVGNKLAAVHDGRSKLSPEDLATRDALLDRLFRERGGRSSLDIVSQLRVEDFATAQIQLGKVTRRLELLGAVSTEGRKRSSLVDTYNVFSARVERLAAELPPPRESAGASGASGVDLSGMTTDQLIERSAKLLRVLLEQRDLQRDGEAYLARASAEHQAAAGLPVQTSADPTGDAPVSTSAPASEPETCRYGCGSLAACAAMKERALDVWRVLHWLDPTEVERRQEYNSREMLATMGRLSRW